MNARDYLTLLRESLLLILTCVVVCVTVAGAITLVLPQVYASSTSFYVVSRTASSVPQQNPTTDLYQGAQLAKDRVKSYSELIVGPRVAEDAAAALGGGVTAVQVQSELEVAYTADTVVLTLTASAGSPDQAVALASAVSTSFRNLVDQLETRPGETAPAITTEILQRPSVPTAPVAPKLSVSLIVGFLLGIVIGFGTAVARRTLDVSIRSVEELEDATDAAVLGAVPEDRGTGQQAISLDISPNGGVSTAGREEAFRRIRTNLEFSNIDGTRRVLVVTSSLTGEGKTTIACNLADALAAVGARVLLVEGDLRHPSIADFLDIDDAVGFTTVLTGAVTLDGAVRRVTTGGFDVLLGGRTPPRPNELVSSRRARALVGELRRRYDFVLIDAPPILPVADAINLGTHADGAIVVCRWGKTSRNHVRSAASFLAAVSVPIAGTILNRAPRRVNAAWGHYGTYSGAAEQARHQQPLPPEHRNGNGKGQPRTNSPDAHHIEEAAANGPVSTPPDRANGSHSDGTSARLVDEQRADDVPAGGRRRLRPSPRPRS